MNRYLVLAVVCLLIVLSLGIWNMGTLLGLASKSTPVRTERAPIPRAAVREEPSATTPPNTIPSEAPRLAQGKHKNTSWPIMAITEECKSEISRLTAEKTILQNRLDASNEKIAYLIHELRTPSEEDNITKRLLTYVGTSVSAIGGIFSIFLGIRKERRDSRKKRRGKEEEDV